MDRSSRYEWDTDQFFDVKELPDEVPPPEEEEATAGVGDVEGADAASATFVSFCEEVDASAASPDGGFSLSE